MKEKTIEITAYIIAIIVVVLITWGIGKVFLIITEPMRNYEYAVCLEYKDKYQWVSWGGSFYPAGDSLEEATKMAGGRPLRKYTECIKWNK